MQYTKHIISLVLFFSVAFPVHAQEEGAVLIADLDVQNAHITSQEEQNIEVFFEWIVGDAVQSGVRYSLQVIDDLENEEGEAVLLDQYIADDVLTLSNNTVTPQYVSYRAPEWLAGTHRVELVAYNTNGLPLAGASLGEVTFSGTGDYVEIDERSCNLFVNGEEYSEETVSIEKGVTDLTFSCLVTNKSAEEVSVHPITFVYKGSLFGEGVGAFPDFEDVYVLSPNETQEILVEILVGERGVFEHQLFLENNEGALISNGVVFGYGVSGTQARLLNVTSDKDAYERGEMIEVTVAYTAQEDIVANVVVMSDGWQCAEEAVQTLSATALQETVSTQATRECPHPVVDVVLRTTGGSFLDETALVFLEDGEQDKTSRLLLLIVLGVIIILLMYVIWKLRGQKRGNDAMVGLFLLAALFISGSITETAHAKTWTKRSSIWSDCNISLTGNLNKSSYDTGSTIQASLTSAVGCGGRYIGSKATGRLSTRGSSKSFNYNSQGKVDSTTQSMTAPSSAGSQSMSFSASLYTRGGGTPKACSSCSGGWANHGSVGGSIGYTTVDNTPPAPTVNLSASPGTITSGSSSTLSWSSSNATSCSGSGSGFSTGGRTSGTDSVSPTSSVTYTVTCTGSGGSGSDSVRVTVNAPNPTASFSASPTTVERGARTRLSWSSSNATSCTGWSFGTGGRTSGSQYVTVNSSTTYGVTCSNANGDRATASQYVRVIDPSPSVSLSASPGTITSGSSSTLSWSSSNATSCSGSGSGFSTGGRTSGTDSVSPSSTTTYSITCTGAGGSDSDTARVTVSAPAPSVNLSASPTTITRGDSTTLSWSSSNATSCSGSGSGFSTGGRTSGTDSVSPTSSVTYTVTCTGSGGSGSDSVRVTVNTPAPPPNVTLRVRNDTQGGSWTASNITISAGDQISLRWDSTNASSCNGSNFSTGGDADGTQSSVSEPSAGSNKTYSVSCVGSGGSDSDSLRVTTQAVDPSLSADETRVREGESVTISYNMNGNDPAQCSLVGPGVSYLAGSFSQQTGSINTTISGDSTFTMTCPGGSVDITVELIPVVFDS